MQIGYSEKTLWRNINHQYEEIDSELKWLNHYIATGEVECVEDCAKNIIDSCKAILENIEHLKGEEM
jgi:hypothetical protein